MWGVLAADNKLRHLKRRRGRRWSVANGAPSAVADELFRRKRRAISKTQHCSVPLLRIVATLGACHAAYEQLSCAILPELLESPPRMPFPRCGAFSIALDGLTLFLAVPADDRDACCFQEGGRGPRRYVGGRNYIGLRKHEEDALQRASLVSYQHVKQNSHSGAENPYGSTRTPV